MTNHLLRAKIPSLSWLPRTRKYVRDGSIPPEGSQEQVDASGLHDDTFGPGLDTLYDDCFAVRVSSRRARPPRH